MKSIFLFTIASIITLGTYAQEKQNDTLKIKWRGSRIWVFDAEPAAKADSSKKVPAVFHKKDFVHWGGLDLGVCMLSTIDNKFKLPTEEDASGVNNFLDLNYSKSLYISWNLIEKNFRLYKNNVILTTGLGIEWNSYNFKKNITLNPDAPYISSSTSTIVSDSIKYYRNKLKITYLKMPLLVQLNSNSENPKRSFHFSSGIELGYKIGSRTKQRFEMNGSEIKVNNRDDYHLADFKYAAVVRIGYGDNLSLFANYGLSELFEGSKKGTEDMDLFPFTVGVSIDF